MSPWSSKFLMINLRVQNIPSSSIMVQETLFYLKCIWSLDIAEEGKPNATSNWIAVKWLEERETLSWWVVQLSYFAVAWKKITLPRAFGGLGPRNLDTQAIAFQGHLIRMHGRFVFSLTNTSETSHSLLLMLGLLTLLWKSFLNHRAWFNSTILWNGLKAWISLSTAKTWG